MIRVEPQPEPPTFDHEVRQPGTALVQELTGDPDAPRRPGPKRRAIAATVAGIPPKYFRKDHFWTRCLPDLQVCYGRTCAYLGMQIHPATGASSVDHFRPVEKRPDLAFEWTNYRLATTAVNGRKGSHEDVLDPFQIEDGWFVLDLGTFEVRAGPDLDSGLRSQVEATIRRLGLNEPIYCESRATYHDECLGLGEAEALGPDWLGRNCPFVAVEMKRQGLLGTTTLEEEASP